ncbi:MAG TPA: mycofactocin system transcriptional regulator [Mycobacteriales bacterium]|nr:mycofactocin system transcriptional regulator [Mycobacteriales bacterium]
MAESTQSAARPRGRPRETSARELEVAALELFAVDGFADTTVEQIAARAGVSKRTFFRYFDSKVDVLWHDFDKEVAELRSAFASVSLRRTLMTAIREVVVSVNRYRAEDVPELRTRMALIGSDPALQASALLHYDAWERAVADFAADRLGEPADSLNPLAIGRVTLAACRAAYDTWLARADADLTVYLDAAIRALATGYRTHPTRSK